MITGAHIIFYSTNPEEDRAFIRDVLKFPHIDAGEGWLIFGLSPAELAFHPSEAPQLQEFYLMSDDIDDLVNQMKSLKVECSQVQHLRWGLLTELRLPSGAPLKIYQPFHSRPKPVGIEGA